MKRWKKWVIALALLPVVLVLLALLLVYLPPVQRFAKDKAAAYAASTLGMDVSVGRVALRFPLSLVVADAYVRDATDTVLYVRELVVDIPLAPLLRQCIEVDAVELHGARVKSKSLIPFYHVEGNIDNLRLESHGVDLRGSRVIVDELELLDTDIDLCITDTAAADTTPSTPLDWVVEVRRVNIENVAFALSMPLDTMSMTSGLDRAVVEDCVADLGRQSYSLRHFRLEGGRFGLNTGGAETPGVFNPSDLLADGVSLEVDSAVYAPLSLRAVLTGIAAREKCGLAIVAGGGRVESDDRNIYVKGLGLRTAASSIDINASAGWGLLDSVPEGAVSLDAAVSVAPADIECFTGKLHGQIPRHPVTVDVNLGGTLDSLDLARLDIGWRDAVTLHAEGQADCLLDSVRRAARLRLEARTGALDFVKLALGLADSAFYIPAGMTLDSHVTYGSGECKADVRLADGGGTVGLDAAYGLEDNSYSLKLSIDSLVVGHFVDIGEMSPVSMDLALRGKGLDPMDKASRARLMARIGRLAYSSYDLSGTEVSGSLFRSHARLELATLNPWLEMNSDLRATLGRRHSDLSLALNVDKIGLADLLGTDSASTGAVRVAVNLATDMDEMLDIEGRIGDVVLDFGGNAARPKDISFSAYTNTGAARAQVSAGDMTLTLRGDNGATQLAGMLQTFTDKLGEQLKEHALNYDKLKAYLPDLRLELRADNDNPFANYLKMMGVNVGQTRIRVATHPVRGVAGDLALRTIGVDSIRLDSAYMWFVQDSTSIRYRLNVANSQTMADYVTGVSLKGEITNRSADLLIDMYDRQGERGVYLGCKGEFVRDGIKMSFFPADPVFLFRTFHLNDSNYVLLGRDKNIYADVSFLDDKGMGLGLRNTTTKKGHNQLTASLTGIDLADIRTLLPMLPDISGIVSADVSYTPLRRTFSLSCDATVDDFVYEKRPVADFSIKAGYVPFGETKQIMNLRLGVNGDEALSVGGKYESDKDAISYRMKLTDLPLSVANPFLPPDFLTLDGKLNGEMRLGGTFMQPVLNGNVSFNDASVFIVQAGTKIRLDNRPLVVKDSRLAFDRFALLTRTDNPFTINGSVDFSDLAAIGTDLQFMASDYELLNARKTKQSLVYGKAFIDAAIGVTGTLDDLKVRGYAKLLGNTNLTYIMKESSLTVQDRLGETVTFTNFNDTTTYKDIEIKPIPITGMDMLLNVSIDPTAAVNIDLSQDGKNRVEVVGGGDLSMQYTAQGDLSLTGRYTFTGGNISYSLPLVNIADFSVKDGSYVDWTGNILNPTMNLTAIKKVRTDVANSNGEGSRKVDFELSVNIYNTLEDLGLSFDIAAPQDADVQNTLAATGEDERRTMALTMMVTGMYIGSGGGTDMNLNMGSALNSLLQKEISSAAGKIKAVDLSLGMENPNGDEGFDNMDISYKISKRFLNDRFNIVIGGTISTGGDAAQSNKESFIDNISVEYRLDNSGTRYVKLFHNKNYESVLEGEITETGAGIVLRKKMLKLSELFTFKRKKPIDKDNGQENRK